jgi:hypothetical protein
MPLMEEMPWLQSGLFPLILAFYKKSFSVFVKEASRKREAPFTMA